MKNEITDYKEKVLKALGDLSKKKQRGQVFILDTFLQRQWGHVYAEIP